MNAENYEVQVSEKGDFSTLFLDQTEVQETNITVSGLSNNTTYFWRVRANNAAGESEWSEVWSFTTLPDFAEPPVLLAPVLAAPANFSINLPTNTDLSWNGSQDAENYELQVSERSDFLTLFLRQTGISGTTATVNNLTSGTTYYWRVKISNAAGESDWSEVWSFTTLPAFAGAPALVWPTNHFKRVTTVTALNWKSLRGAKKYRVQISKVKDFSNLVLDQDNLSRTFTFVNGLDHGTTYYWRVEATNSLGATSSWSEVWNFTTIHKVNIDLEKLFNYPNPFTNQTTVTFSFPVNTTYTATLYDLKGYRVGKVNKGEARAGVPNELDISGAGLAKGVYFLKIIPDVGKSKTTKIIKI